MYRVAQVITKFTAGAGGVALRGALALDSRRFSVTILTAGGGSLAGDAERAGLEVIQLRHLQPVLDARSDVLALRELTQQFRHRGFDVVHTHSSKAGALGRLAAHRLGVPGIVHTLHGFPFHEFQLPLWRYAYIQIERRLGRITDEFLAVGVAVAAQAIRLGIAAPDRIRAIASAIDPVGLHPASVKDREAARQAMGLPLEVKVIGTVGRLDYQKAPADMVRAVAELGREDVYLVWVGGGPLEKSVRRLAVKKALRQRFLLLGERDDVKRLLPGFDLFAMSSLYEGLPCALVEAVTAGIPVVATAVNAVPEVVVPGRTGLLVPPAAPRQLSRALAYLLNHPDVATRMATAAAELIGDRFHPEALGRDLEETYESALAAPVRAVRAPTAMAGPSS